MMQFDLLSEHDRDQLETFVDFLRRIHEAERAGCSRVEAAVMLHDDVYLDKLPTDNNSPDNVSP